MMSGMDEKGSYYPSIDEMWEIELNNKATSHKIVDRVGSAQKWYDNAKQYWNKSQATYDGVLGGYANLSSLDIKFSLKFILELCQQNQSFTRNSVLDCGAGIGRISKELLCQIFKQVDLIDQCQKLVDKSKQILKEKNARHFYCKGLQSFKFEEKYDCVWIQWVISHLSDHDAVQFLKKSKQSLAEHGVIILKENHCKIGFVVDKDDCSVTRSPELYKKLIQEAGLKIVKEEIQLNWPSDLFGLRMYALQ